MKKYLEDLRKELKKKHMTEEEIEEIIADHVEMFESAQAEGLNEEDIIKKFGEPKQVAEELSDFEYKHTENKEVKAYTLLKAFDITKETLKVTTHLVSEYVSYQPSTSDQIQIYYKGTGNIGKYDIDYKNDELFLKSPRSSNFLFFRNRKDEFSFIVEIPITLVIEEFTQSGINGSVGFEGLKAINFHIRTINGDIKLKDADLGEVKLNAVNGDMEIEQSKFTSLYVSEISGDISLENVTIQGSFRFQTVSGDANIKNTTCHECDMNSVSGDIEGHEFYPQKVSLKSVSGDIKIKNERSDSIEVVKKSSVSGDVKVNF
ncbi:MAG: DUF4097 family beta strand repeat protein [Acholeplasmataceae bacterium]|nr:DUF4097 family beta strand repeat protein [Acholeplasmataceae bacterium]